MEKEIILNDLPSEIVFVILSKLPTRSIATCKCVYKSWLNLVGSREFVEFHLSHSAPCLVIGPTYYRASYKIFEMNDDLDLQHHDLHYTLLTKFHFPQAVFFRGSTDGLLLLQTRSYGDLRLYVCNPVTRDYIELPKVLGFEAFPTYGFGASRMSGQHKVVGISHGYMRDGSGSWRATESECRVYTLGTGRWRRIAASGDCFNYGENIEQGAAFVKGNLHWLVFDDVKGGWLISCFDLEAEVFSTIPPPPGCVELGGYLCVVGNWLCFYDERRSDDEMTIWLNKEEKGWTKEFVITRSINYMYPIKVFGDGDILFAPFMYYFSTKTTLTSQALGISDRSRRGSIIYTPSFLSLKSFGMETATFF